MNKIILFFSVLTISLSCFAQSPRMQLIEEFTTEDKPECAQQNPAFNTLITTNSNNVIALKYEVVTSHPGPIFTGGAIAYTSSGNVGDRILYYGLSNSPLLGTYTPLPYGLQDGKAFLKPNNTDTGKLVNLSQTDINNRALIPSPFSINLTHWFNSTFDTIYVQAIITASQSFTAFDTTLGSLKFNLAIVENEIHLKNATGTNTLRDFYNTARKLLPSGPTYHGITLSNSWGLGQSITLLQQYPLHFYPLTNVYDYSQLSAVGFIQDDGYKGDVNQFSVLQAAQSASVPMPSNLSDIGIENITPLPLSYCRDSLTPTFKITNYTLPVITMFSVEATSNDFKTSKTKVWTGSLQKDSFTIVVFPKDTLSKGANTIVGRLTFSNGYAIGNSTSSFANKHDFNCSNNLSNASFPNYYSVPKYALDTSWFVSFDDIDEPYTIVNPKQVKARIVYKTIVPGATNNLGAYANSQHSFAWNFINMRDYTLDHSSASIVLNKIKLTGKTAVGLAFDYAYAKENNSSNDTLQVLASTDCGDHWQTVWLKSGNTLATASDDTSGYFAPTGTQWKSALVDLTNYNNTPDLMIRFDGIEDGGNMLYIDNINLKAGLFSSINNVYEPDNKLSLFPNPSTGLITVHSFAEAKMKTIEIYNAFGALILLQNINTENSNIDLGSFASGLYFVKVMNENGDIYTGKVIKQ